jgi:hypothetical protein
MSIRWTVFLKQLNLKGYRFTGMVSAFNNLSQIFRIHIVMRWPTLDLQTLNIEWMEKL